MKKILIGLALGAAAAAPSWAQDYPSQAIKFIVPFPAGQASDTISRLVGEQLALRLKQPVIVENKAGAGGNIGSEIGARAKPDGYTITVATAALPISRHVRKLSFDPGKDFKTVALMTVTPLVLITRPDMPANSVKELIGLVKKDPGKYTFASSGVGTSHHLSGELFKSLEDLDILHVPYQGSSAAHIDMIAGRVDMMFDNIVPVTPHLAEKKLKALAVTTKERAPAQPGIPTMSESGYPEFEAVAWFGLLAPKDTPDEIVEKLNREVNAVLQLPAVKERLEGMGAFVQNRSAQDFGAFMQAEIAKWGPVVQKAKIQLD
ncbi:Bug family tripartite tricarboxylate transporter substrate binding protein [Parapusillimonas granuli]|uniref:Tripartite tricarboxylate transporter substrate binding protein n=1 Tax=Parapusillimonas granuli TaxID=380911 RepID=A0A853G2H3_9BURK|nr:tripartite tricarboxylate transporter substrate binding protein [Parapusillimonas granuli]MBB5214621.1 tripartite-type tricarboxylate transporter receptor subunit TctC [Parapusillimonas granuli]MEB2398131.1 tripartite tricarboxylate transporter substrate binding protein [Alcaligenaceae bacterium]NYT48971.1 tripartite tricarboxylate transporter substrate binding protein [Parapusillimonas granuli]